LDNKVFDINDGQYNHEVHVYLYSTAWIEVME